MASTSIPRLRYRFGKLNLWNRLGVIATLITIVGAVIVVSAKVYVLFEPSHVTLSKEQVVAITEQLSVRLDSQREATAERLNDRSRQIDALKDAVGFFLNEDADAVRKALKLIEQGRVEEARLLLSEVAVRSALRAKRSLKRSAEAYRHLGALYFPANTQKSFDAYEHSQTLDPLNPEALYWLGWLYDRKKKSKEAAEFFHEALGLAEHAKDTYWMSATLRAIAAITLDVDLPRARSLGRRSLSILGNVKNISQKARSNFLLGQIESQSGNKDAATEHFCESWAQAEATKQHDLVACSILGLSALDEASASPNWAIDAINEHLKAFEEDHRTLRYAQALTVLSHTLERQEKLDQAYKVGLKARDILEEKRFLTDLANVEALLAFLSRKMKNFSGSCSHFLKSYRSYRKLAMNQEAYAIRAWMVLTNCAAYR